MDSLTIRETFLSYFEDRGHTRFDSAPLIPNDPTLLLTIAGMVPFKPYFLGNAKAPFPRATSFQKCVRTNDIENVGRTARHLSMFEMLGNFSFGDYFKRDAIRFAWELSTGPFGLDPNRIWVTIHESDDESAKYWLEESDIPLERLQRVGAPAGATRLDASDNFWSLGGPGPCGPCSELHYDRGPAWGDPGGPEFNSERYLEFYNLVFMQYEQDDDGKVVGDLPAKSVDTGLGLERMAMLKQDADDVFATDRFVPLIERAASLSQTSYGRDEHTDVSMRVLAEHARTAAFLIADGVLPSKEGRGYVLRRLLRRAIRHGQLLGKDVDSGDSVILPMVDAVIESHAAAYPDLERQRELITKIAGAEEEDFGARLRDGLKRVGQIVSELRQQGTVDAFPAREAFELHDTFGFPIDLTAEIADEAGLPIDRDGFEELMQEQRQRAREGAKKSSDAVGVETYREAAGLVGATEFVGYDALTAESRIGAIVVPGGLLATASEGDDVEIVMPRSPFYAEGGGQVGDEGLLSTPTGRLEVFDTQEAIEGLTVHRARIVSGEVSQGQDVEAVVQPDRRIATARSHSATHVLHATVKEALGDHAQQAGSLVQPGRFRFDFPHFEALSPDQVQALEDRINERVLRDPFVRTEVMSLEAAKASGAVANFGDRYGQRVRVVTIGEFSKELCGGTHVPSGATIGSITIVREESIGSNTRRIEALTGESARAFLSKERLIAEEIARLVEVPTDQAVSRVQDLLDRLKAAEKQLSKARAASLSQQARELAQTDDSEFGTQTIVRQVDGLSMDELRSLAAEVRGQLIGSGVVVLGCVTEDGKAQLVAALTSDLSEQGFEARPILQGAAQAVGGGAGGKGDLAQAGGKAGDKLGDALELARQEIHGLLGER